MERPMKTKPTKPRVMFVDDDPMLLASTRRQLMLKMETATCYSAAAATKH